MAGGARRTADAVVVGAGSAGLAVAHALSHDWDVVLLEGGPLAAPSAATRRLTTLPLGGDRARRYAEARGRVVVRGRGLGGSAAVNGGYFLRGHSDDYADWPWPQERIAATFDRLDGGAAGGGTMRVSAYRDAELGSVAAGFESHWRTRGIDSARTAPWAGTGLHRVRANRQAGARWTVADVFPPRADGTGLLRATATALIEARGAIVGVHTTVGRIDAPEIILAAGTLGSGALLAPWTGPLTTLEHPERVVRFAPRTPLPPVPLLQAVLHTDDGLEFRCYSDDFAFYIPGVERRGVPIGVADMSRPARGVLTANGALDLGEPDEESRARLARGVDDVVAMLRSPAFADLVEPGSIAVDPVIGMSSHTWGTLPLGERTDAGGRVDGLDGVRVVDGSVLPALLRSGPHASILAAASLIADTIRAE
ncbi:MULTISPECIES: mycofactocin system GMC family oxidoreductase MftG [Tsukamurella]|uniref:Mycofactocin system GMC family oxidoreductase MftG n=2 Tax=Tsukamurella TaxID=2060 RepID=A0A5C5S3D4_9ACTN|nr:MULTISPECIES: mycofactocin system GMC family oxidoreductase MftG [Tsukamurella]NMD57442.1 mycofactocin system GMC family oxidoreductase MftG [Tsukamurella columbiensis]TWS29956.1 mycofactocin system GMC family oxidoreductase MftG [Tsukamurella conjunctivitidis]